MRGSNSNNKSQSSPPRSYNDKEYNAARGRQQQQQQQPQMQLHEQQQQQNHHHPQHEVRKQEELDNNNAFHMHNFYEAVLREFKSIHSRMDDLEKLIISVHQDQEKQQVVETSTHSGTAITVQLEQEHAQKEEENTKALLLRINSLEKTVMAQQQQNVFVHSRIDQLELQLPPAKQENKERIRTVVEKESCLRAIPDPSNSTQVNMPSSPLPIATLPQQQSGSSSRNTNKTEGAFPLNLNCPQDLASRLKQIKDSILNAKHELEVQVLSKSHHNNHSSPFDAIIDIDKSNNKNTQKIEQHADKHVADVKRDTNSSHYTEKKRKYGESTPKSPPNHMMSPPERERPAQINRGPPLDQKHNNMNKRPQNNNNAPSHMQNNPQEKPYYPCRPNEPLCQYYMQNGSCKFSPNCRYHHPPSRLAKPQRQPFSNNEIPHTIPHHSLPQHPDEPVCKLFVQSGGKNCKYDQTCKFHHPLPSEANNNNSMQNNNNSHNRRAGPSTRTDAGNENNLHQDDTNMMQNHPLPSEVHYNNNINMQSNNNNNRREEPNNKTAAGNEKNLHQEDTNMMQNYETNSRWGPTKKGINNTNEKNINHPNPNDIPFYHQQQQQQWNHQNKNMSRLSNKQQGRKSLS